MKRVLLVALLIAVVGAALAFYLGWIAFRTENTGGTYSVTFLVNCDKFHEDTQKALAKAGVGTPAAEPR